MIPPSLTRWPSNPLRISDRLTSNALHILYIYITFVIWSKSDQSWVQTIIVIVSSWIEVKVFVREREAGACISLASTKFHQFPSRKRAWSRAGSKPFNVITQFWEVLLLISKNIWDAQKSKHLPRELVYSKLCIFCCDGISRGVGRWKKVSVTRFPIRIWTFGRNVQFWWGSNAEIWRCLQYKEKIPRGADFKAMISDQGEISARLQINFPRGGDALIWCWNLPQWRSLPECQITTQQGGDFNVEIYLGGDLSWLRFVLVEIYLGGDFSRWRCWDLSWWRCWCQIEGVGIRSPLNV